MLSPVNMAKDELLFAQKLTLRALYQTLIDEYLLFQLIVLRPV